MVKLNLDTNRDAVVDLEEAIELLQEAVTRRKVSEAVEQGPGKAPSAQDLVEETAIDAGWLKITVESDEPVEDEIAVDPEEPISESELTDMFQKHAEVVGEEEEEDDSGSDDGDIYIEIIDSDKN